MNAIQSKRVKQVLQALHQDARNDYRRMGRGIVKSIFRPMQPEDFKHAYLPISSGQGAHLRQLIIERQSKNVVEFGTSFGISTIYLADGVRQTGGKVISTELIESKALRASQNIKQAGLQDYVEIWTGDALQTLKGYTGPFDFLFLDGWKDLYLPLFQQLEAQFHAGTIIYADNMDMSGTQAYARYVLGKHAQYLTRTVDEGKGFLSVVTG
ncbi:MAG: class I SAM-dependent methyltransferase [Bacteroidota bacterium]